MTMTAATAVAAFETVGSILVVAMFIVPPATAYLLTNRYGLMCVFAILLSVLAAGIGHLSAITIPTWFGFSGTSTAGAMAVSAGVLFLVAWIASPTQGMVMQLWNRSSVRLLVLCEDILGVLWRLEERGQVELLPIQLSEAIGVSPRRVRVALFVLQKRDSVTKSVSRWSLTEVGRVKATTLVRSHRLWEVYLDKHFPQDKHQLHHSASRLEHVTTQAMKLTLGNADIDPHGSPVPDDE
jgi:manganese/zinc/iron transport system permease protein